MPNYPLARWFSNFLVSGCLYALKIINDPENFLFIRVILLIFILLEIKAENLFKYLSIHSFTITIINLLRVNLSYEKQLYFPKEAEALLYISISLFHGQLNMRWLYILISASYFNLL